MLKQQKTARGPINLSLAALPQISSSIERPLYQRSDLQAGIVHFGIGNFHRAHMAVYLHELMQKGLARDWAIIGTGVKQQDVAMRADLAQQDWLTTVIERDDEQLSAKVTGSMVDFIHPQDRAANISALVAPQTRLVSLTVTEGGYPLDSVTGQFDSGSKLLGKASPHPDFSNSAFSLIVAALRLRKSEGLPPFTVLSCDNLPHNGVACRNAVVGLARLVDPELAHWIDDKVRFPSSMVDRITPATTESEQRFVLEELGVVDRQPVFCEPFKQWVIEDAFSNGRPPLEQAGAMLVADVAPFETMKIRMLNGGHAAIAYPAGLLGIHFVHDAMQHPLISGFLRKLLQVEIIPNVPAVPGTNLEHYAAALEHRFANAQVGDTIRRLCFDGSNRQTKFIIPTIRDAIGSGRPISGLALESALWCRYCAGVTEANTLIEANDPNWNKLMMIGREARAQPAAWLGMQDIYGELGEVPAFRDAFSAALNSLWTRGVDPTLADWLELKGA